MFKLDVNFEIFKLSISFNQKNPINYGADIIHATV